MAPPDEKAPLAVRQNAPLRVGSLCTGIRGLDLAVEAHFGAETVWYSEIEKALVPWLAERMPDVPNLGDLKLIDWEAIPPIDILTAGYPCQPFSHAGKREGTDDPRHLWPFLLDAIRHLRPRYVVVENVRGHLTLGFDAVLGSLAEAGFDAEWCLLRASDVGACHQRARIFLVATDATGSGRGWEPTGARGRRVPAERSEAVDLAHDGATPRGALTLLPTPVVNDMGANKTPEQWDAWTDAMQAKHGNGNGHGKSLSIEAQRIETLPTPKASDAARGGDAERWKGTKSMNGRRSNLVDAAMHFPPPVDWGIYEPAIRQHEVMIGRPPPAPKLDNKLSPAFVEWMMGYPAGWVDGLLRTHALKALGNAVMPQQALAALAELCPAQVNMTDEDRAAIQAVAGCHRCGDSIGLLWDPRVQGNVVGCDHAARSDVALVGSEATPHGSKGAVE